MWWLENIMNLSQLALFHLTQKYASANIHKEIPTECFGNFIHSHGSVGKISCKQECQSLRNHKMFKPLVLGIALNTCTYTHTNTYTNVYNQILSCFHTSVCLISEKPQFKSLLKFLKTISKSLNLFLGNIPEFGKYK